jgi:alpha-1,2-mannosyltransferase
MSTGRANLLRCLFQYTLVAVLGVNLLILLVAYFSGTHQNTIWTDVGNLLQFQSGDDSWMPMNRALDILLNSQTPVYEQLFFIEKVKFQYPLTSLIPLYLLRGLLQEPDQLLFALHCLSLLAVLATVYFAVRILLKAMQDNGIVLSTKERTAWMVLAGIMVLNFYPVIKAFSLGQLQAIINLLVTAALWQWMQQKKTTAGILIALAVLCKPQYGLLLLWAAIRKEWRFAIGMIVVLAIGGLTALWLFGFEQNIAYLKVLSHISKIGEGFYANQSMNGLLNRWLFNGNNLYWDAKGFAPFHPVVYYGSLLVTVLLLMSALILPVRAGAKSTYWDIGIMILSATAASPVAWEHHYGVVIGLFAAALPFIWIRSQKTIWLLALSYLLVSNCFTITNVVAEYPIINVAQSYLYLGVLLLLYCLYTILYQGRLHQKAL